MQNLARIQYVSKISYLFSSMGDDKVGGSGIAMAKTPVSLLQELYVKKGITPKYDLVQVRAVNVDLDKMHLSLHI